MAKLNPLRFFSSKKDASFGLDQSVTGNTRFVLSDGTFNVKKSGRHWWDTFNIYHWVTSVSWPVYWGSLASLYLTLNIIFGSIYFMVGPENIIGIPEGPLWKKWIFCFFFSNQTFTTVGYGGMHPVSIASSMVAAVEAFLGLMVFALATGSLYSRFSKPHIKIKYSEHLLISPHENKNAMMFMLANAYNTSLMEVEAFVNLSWLDHSVSPAKRRFTSLKLDIPKITMFATNWVVVHVIDEESPLLNLTREDCINESIQVFILIKAFDDTFSQTVYSRKSYLSTDLVWGARFVKPYYQDPNSSKVIVDLNKVGQYELADLH